MLWWELRAGWLWRSALREIRICTALGLSLGHFQGPRQLCLTSSQHGHFWALLLSGVYGNAGVFIFFSGSHCFCCLCSIVSSSSLE